MNMGKALITGGGRGIGRAIAERLAADGYDVIVAGRNMKTLQDVADSFNGVAVEMDVGDRDSTDRALRAVREAHGRVDVLVSNAGITATSPVHRTDDEAFERLWRVNAEGPFRLCRQVLPDMIDAGFGRVVVVASVASLTGFPYATAYCASKHAVVGVVRAIAKELASKPNVTINAVCPGWVRTDMAAQVVAAITKKTGRNEREAYADLARMSPQNRLLAPEEVANVVSMLVGPHANGINGECITLDGGQLAA